MQKYRLLFADISSPVSAEGKIKLLQGQFDRIYDNDVGSFRALMEGLIERRNKGLCIQIGACSCHPAEYKATYKLGDKWLTDFAGALDHPYQVKGDDYLEMAPAIRSRRLSAAGLPQVVDVPYKEIDDYLPKRLDDVMSSPMAIAPTFTLPPTKSAEEEAADHQRMMQALDDNTGGNLKRTASSSLSSSSAAAAMMGDISGAADATTQGRGNKKSKST